MPLRAVPGCYNLLKPIALFCKLHNVHVINCVHFQSRTCIMTCLSSLSALHTARWYCSASAVLGAPRWAPSVQGCVSHVPTGGCSLELPAPRVPRGGVL